MQYYNGKKINYHSYTVEPDDRSDRFVVYGHSFYPASSVLAGQQMKSYMGIYVSIDEALKEYPKAEVLGFKTEVNNSVDHLPENDF